MSISDPGPAIEFRNVSKGFARVHGQLLMRNFLAQHFRAVSRKRDRYYALRNVSFRVDYGESLGIIGPNGAGKSTLLALMAGLTRPDEGEVTVYGRLAGLLELGSGFHHDLTGAENVRLNASLLGLSRKRTAELFDEIVEFAGIGDFIGEPLRTYSMGMVMRLAFAVAVNTEPAILLVDEVLAVGDQAFQAKCFDRIRSFRQQGKTLVFVSHATDTIRQHCDRALWLDHGSLVMAGEAAEVVDAYLGKAAIAGA